MQQRIITIRICNEEAIEGPATITGGSLPDTFVGPPRAVSRGME